MFQNNMSFSPQRLIEVKIEKWLWQQTFHQIFNCLLCKKFYDLEARLNQASTITQTQHPTFVIVHRKPDDTIRCPKCGRIFKQKAYLQKHLKICNIDNKPLYKCICDESKIFASTSSLKRHINIYQNYCNERPCIHHQKMKPKINNRLAEIKHPKKGRTMPQAIPNDLICPICHKQFKNKSSYTTHKSKMHLDKT